MQLCFLYIDMCLPLSILTKNLQKEASDHLITVEFETEVQAIK